MCAHPLTSGNIAALSGWRRWQARFVALMPEMLRRHLLHDEHAETHGGAGLGALLSFAVRITSSAIIFIAQVLIARWLGAHDFGIYTYAWVMVNVIGTLATVGLAMSAVRFLNEYMEHDKPVLARGFLRFGRWVSFSTALLAMLLAEAALYFWPGVIDPIYRQPLMIALLSLPAFALTDFHDGTGRARGWLMLALVPPYILRPLLVLLFTGVAILLLDVRNANIAAAALAVAIWLTAIIQFVLQERRFRDVLGTPRPQCQRMLWLKVSLPLLLLDSFTLLMMNIDVLLLKLFVSPAELAVYFAAARIISFVAFVHFAVTAVAMPRFATAYARRDIASASRLLRQFRMWTFAPSLAAAGLLLVVGPFVLGLFGPEFPTAWPVMVVLAAGHLARALAGPAEAMLAVSGKQVYSAVITGITAGLNIVLNLALIPRYGLFGAGAATAGAYLFQSAILWVATNRLVREGYAQKPGEGAVADV